MVVILIIASLAQAQNGQILEHYNAADSDLARIPAGAVLEVCLAQPIATQSLENYEPVIFNLCLNVRRRECDAIALAARSTDIEGRLRIIGRDHDRFIILFERITQIGRAPTDRLVDPMGRPFRNPVNLTPKSITAPGKGTKPIVGGVFKRRGRWLIFALLDWIDVRSRHQYLLAETRLTLLVEDDFWVVADPCPLEVRAEVAE
ncbi:MAG: hypothetical protein GC160_27320 [Acidobacteria bacterium]|nr:hypothetical protein [Acidobacteriota bacterium]